MLPKNLLKKHQHIGLDVDETLAASVMDGIKKLHAMNKMKFIQDLEQITSFDWTVFSECDLSTEELNHFWQHHAIFHQHALTWSSQLAVIPDLTFNLVEFCKRQ